MGRREAEPLQKHLISLYKGDLEILASFYAGRVPANKIVRVLVRNTIRKIEEARNLGAKQMDDEDVGLTEEELLNIEAEPTDA